MPSNIPISVPVSPNQIALNTDYNNLRTDALMGAFLWVHNNDVVTLNQGDPVILDSSYTAGGIIGVRTSSVASDPRGFGVVSYASIVAGANGFIAIGNYQLVNVTGVVVFGHTLGISTTPHYAYDVGGGGIFYGMIGRAVQTNGGGTGQILAQIVSNPLFYTAAQVITNSYGATQIASGAQTLCASVVSVTPNQLLLFGAFNSAGTFTVPLWNAQTPAVLQAYSGAAQSYIGAGLGWGAATSNYTGNFSAGSSVAFAIALNGINQGGGASTFGAVVHQAYSAAGTITLVVTCVPGDLVVCLILVAGAGGTPGISAENQPIVEKSFAAATGYEVMKAIATGNSVTFTATLAGSTPSTSMDGFALHSA